MSFLDEVGGVEKIRRVHKIFYDAIYEHPWFRQIFEEGTQERLETQQTDFMAQNFGGEPIYRGRTPGTAHPHIMITDEMFDVRAELLADALLKAGVSEENSKRWLRIDEAFRRQIVKTSPLECKGRYNNDPIINIPNPANRHRRAG